MNKMLINFQTYVSCVVFTVIATQWQTSYSQSFASLACNFNTDNSFCQWKPSALYPSANWKWRDYATRSVEFNGALAPPLNTGKFIQVFTPDNVTYEANADLQSPMITDATKDYCFTFFYYISGYDVKSVELSMVQSDTPIPLWERRHKYGDQWHQYSVNIAAQAKPYNLKFVTSTLHGAVGLDEFAAYEGECLQADMCDFERGMCGWTSTGSNQDQKFKFNMIRANDATLWGGANHNTYDHSTESESGHFVEAANGNLNDQATLTSPLVNGAIYKTQCLQFWFWRHNSTSNKIQVFNKDSSDKNNTKSQLYWEAPPSFPNRMWHRASVTMSFISSANYVEIKAIKLDEDQNSPIDIDDISLTPLACAIEITCDFNKDLCGWSRNMDDPWLWDHGVGRVEDATALKFSLPPMDPKPNGLYVYTDFTAMPHDGRLAEMRLNSEYVHSMGQAQAYCLTFYYTAMTFVEPNSTFAINLLDTTGKNVQNVFTYEMTKDPVLNFTSKPWTRNSVSFTANITYWRLQLYASTTSRSTYLAVDEISLNSGQCTGDTTVPPPTPPKETGKDLGCDFETPGNTCAWSGGPANNWATVSPNELDVTTADNELMPKTDHTQDSKFGRYAFIKHTVDVMAPNVQGVMNATDNAVEKYEGKVCFMAAYFMRTKKSAVLNFTMYNPKGEFMETITELYDMGDAWHDLSFEVDEASNGYIFSISGQVENGVIAVDDIKVAHQPCAQVIPNANLNRCTFEEGHNCSFTPEFNFNSTYNWALYRGRDTYIKTFDHTYHSLDGHYMAIDFSDSNTTIKTTGEYTLFSKKFPPTQGSCVTFSYYMRGLLHSEQLSVSLKSEQSFIRNATWFAAGESGPFWYSHRFTVNSLMNWQILFTIGANQTNEGLIAIDDVIVDMAKPCPPRGRCDFESGDTCMWENVNPSTSSISQQQKLKWSDLPINTTAGVDVVVKTDFTWTVRSPSRDYNPSYPLTDHTLGNRNGFFAFLKNEVPRKAGDRAVLMSDRYDIDHTVRQICLRFWFYIANPATFQAKTRLEVFQSESYDSVVQIGAVGGNNQSWNQYSVTARPLNSTSTTMWFYLLGTTGAQNSWIAIDDISVDVGDCQKTTDNVFHCSPTETIPANKVCDGVKDCANGLDETDCGNCHFKDQNMCGYTTWHSDENNTNAFQWRLGQVGMATGPRSAPDGSTAFMVASIGSTATMSGAVTELYTPMLNGVDSGCYAQFDFNIRANRQSPQTASTTSLSIIEDRMGFERTELFNTDVVKVNEGQWYTQRVWTRRLDYKFRLIFRALTSGQSNDTYIAVTNIVLSPDCSLNKTAPQSCQTSLFSCANKRCISPYFVCDFNDDCGDGSDESVETCAGRKYRCNFENGLCNWGRYMTNMWSYTSGGFSLAQGPTRDHTKGINSGHFLMMKASSSTNATITTIDGPEFEPSTNCYMTLWADMEGMGSNSGNFSVDTEDLKTGLLTNVFKTFDYSFPNRKFWYTRYNVFFNGLKSPFRVLLTGSIGPISDQNSANYIAVDDISFSPGCVQAQGQSTGTPVPIETTTSSCPGKFMCVTTKQCIPMEKVCNFHPDCGPTDKSDEINCGNCTFDSGSSCGWHNIGQGKLQWEVKGAFISNQVLPYDDGAGNKNGSFMIIDTTSGGTSTTVPAVISTNTLGAMNEKCRIQFMYHHLQPIGESNKIYVSIYNTATGLEKQLLSTTTWTQGFGLTWRPINVALSNLPAGYQVRIGAWGEMLATTAPYVDFAVDEIEFVDCDPSINPPDPSRSNLTCDFEYGTCGWYDAGLGTTDSIDWVRTNDYAISPGHDHTSRLLPTPKYFGYWMYTKRQPKAMGNNTATFMSIAEQPQQDYSCIQFWYHMYGRDSLNFSLGMNNMQSFDGSTTIWLKKIPLSNNWVLAQANIPGRNQGQTKPYYLMFRASLQGYSNDSIGLDDITVLNSRCPPTPVCDFEFDFCDWSHNDQDIIRANATSSSIPPFDHTLGTSEGSYARIQSVNKLDSMAFKLNNTGFFNPNLPVQQNMCLKMWYYFGGTQTNGDYVQIMTSKGTPQVTNAVSVGQLGNLNQWLYMRYSFLAKANDTIEIGGQISSNDSVIAFDDIQIQNSACERPGMCDFENDFCGWTDAPAIPNKRRVLWERNSGQTHSVYGPRSDHTTGTEEGWYVFVPLDDQFNGVASLQSETLSMGSTVCFGFYYHIWTQNSKYEPLLSVSYAVPNETAMTFLANITSDLTRVWTKFNKTITNLPQNYRFILSTYEGRTSRADVAVDDIFVLNYACDQGQVVTVAPPTTPEPVIDKQWDCDFESQCKGWTSDANWQVTNWNVTSKLGPRTDHTLRNTKGHFMMYTAQPNAPNPVSLVSTPITIEPMIACFSFYYFIDTESKLNLTVGFTTDSPNKYIELYRTHPSIIAKAWKLAMTAIALDKNIKISIGINHTLNGFVGAVAIDDIRLTPGQCTEAMGSVCDFGSGYCGYSVQRTSTPYSFSGIGYIQDGYDKFTQGLPGPYMDHTSGDSAGEFFLFAKRKANPNYAYTTNLIINDLKPNVMKAQCLKFWYQIQVNYSSSFSIYVVPVNQKVYFGALWQPSYANFTTWTMGQLTVNVPFQHKIVISFVMPKDYNNSWIALDDISLTNGQCEAPVSCDFEEDSCSWNNVPSPGVIINRNWARYTSPPPPNTTWIGPPYDHTVKGPGGSYLYLKSAQNPTSIRADMESMVVPLIGDKCLSVWTQLFGNNTSLELSLHTYGTNWTTGEKIEQIQSVLNVSAQRIIWSQYSVAIDPGHYVGVRDIKARVTGYAKQANSFIALDDIRLADGKCPESQTFVCTDGKELSLEKVCNFVNDCPHAPYDDELNCGVCDFEKDTCGWTNLQRYGYQWMRRDASDRRVHNDPQTDGANKTTGHYMILDEGSATSIAVADLQSITAYQNQFKRAYHSCEMTFHYYMSVSEIDSYLEVKIRSPFGSSNVLVWRQAGDHGLEWSVANVSIGAQTSFIIDINGFYSQTTDGVLAIDDISFANCAPPEPTTGDCPNNAIKCKNNNVCIDKNVLCDGVDDCGDYWDEAYMMCYRGAGSNVSKCTFETDCGWSKEMDGSTGWTVIQVGSQQYLNALHNMTGPTTDHTSIRGQGSYLALEALSPKDYGTKSRLLTPMIVTGKDTPCAMRVFYYMFGNSSQMGSLSIYVRYSDADIKAKEDFVRKGDLGQRWYRAIYEWTDTRPFQFVIEGQVGSGVQSDIVVDDISFTNGCQPSDAKPVTQTPGTSTTLSSSGTSSVTTEGNPNVGKGDKEVKHSKAGAITAGVLVPVLLIGAVLGAWYYRRYRREQRHDDRIAFTVNGDNENVCIQSTSAHNNPHFQGF